MPRRKNDILIPAIRVIIDALAIESAFIFSFFLRFDTSLLRFLPLTEAVPPLSAYLLSSLVVIPLWLLIFGSGGMYRSRRNSTLADELFGIVKYATIGMLVVMSAAFFYREFSYSRVVFVLLWAVSTLFLFFGRIIALQIEKRLYRLGKELRNAAIIGWNDAAMRIYTAVRNHPMLGYRIMGYFEDQGVGLPANGSGVEIPCLGSIADVPDQLVDRQIELALITLDHTRREQLYCLVHECEGIDVEFMMAPDMLELLTSRMEIKEIEGIPFIKIKGIPMTTWGLFMKRTFDFVVSLALVIVLLPIYIILAIIIKLDSRGPVFYLQERVGEDGRKFTIMKFRSMYVDAESNGPVWSLGSTETRHTRIGQYLRRTSLDELPQLLNVLKGEMSLVGPRPERPYFVEQFKSRIPKYLDRHRVRAGMTGWAQVNGLRGDSSIEERIKYDIYYMENWSLAFDIKILFRTIGEVIHQLSRK